MLQTLSLMGAGFINALSPINLLAMALSTALGIVIGCLPGLSAAMGVALLLPMTFTMRPETGLIVLGGIYCGVFTPTESAAVAVVYGIIVGIFVHQHYASYLPVELLTVFAHQQLEALPARLLVGEHFDEFLMINW